MEGLGAAAGASEPRAARERTEEPGRPSISFKAYISFFFFFKLRDRKLNNPPFNKFKQSSVCLCVR